MENEAERTAGEGVSGAVPAGVSGVSGSAGTDRGDGLDADSLIPRLSAIEDRPLDQRAAALAELHDELRSRLEGGDAAVARG